MIFSFDLDRVSFDTLSELRPEFWADNSICQGTETTAHANQHVHARVCIVAL